MYYFKFVLNGYQLKQFYIYSHKQELRNTFAYLSGVLYFKRSAISNSSGLQFVISLLRTLACSVFTVISMFQSERYHWNSTSREFTFGRTLHLLSLSEILTDKCFVSRNKAVQINFKKSWTNFKLSQNKIIYFTNGNIY